MDTVSRTTRAAARHERPPKERDTGASIANANASSLGRLVKVFLAWKALLLCIACLSPGPGYDTSTDLLLTNASTTSIGEQAQITKHVALRMTRWDALYFVNSSFRGHLHEQEWAFSWLFSRVIAILTSALPGTHASSIISHAMIGIIMAHLSHLAAAIVLYLLILQTMPGTYGTRCRIAFTTATLFVLSPAGIFLSAPYAESSFALFNFAGMLCYVLAARQRVDSSNPTALPEAIWTIASGICYAIASTLRGNGLFSGIPFAWDAITSLSRLARRPTDYGEIRRLLLTVAAGSILACGFVAPQAVAYVEYCTRTNSRPWCLSIPPSIYTFVQSYYWNVGFLRYWTMSNLPLFLLAAPVGWLMTRTALKALFTPRHLLIMTSSPAEQEGISSATDERVFLHVIPRFALVQLVLAVLAITSFHCQIINRISSGYPLWYACIAIEAAARGDGTTKTKQTLTGISAKWVIKGFVLYAMIQGSLYAAFLPPA